MKDCCHNHNHHSSQHHYAHDDHKHRCKNCSHDEHDHHNHGVEEVEAGHDHHDHDSCHESDHHEHKGHDHHDHAHHHDHGMHGGPEMAADFLRRFWVVTVLLVPLFVFSDPGIKFLGIGDFGLRRYLLFGIASAIFYYGWVFFEHAKHEIAMKKYGMMTLVSIAVGAGFAFSAASTFIPALRGTSFYLEIATLIWVLLFGHYLEAKSSVSAADALQAVAKLLPSRAHVVEEDKVIDVEVSDLQVGQVVLVKAGEKVPADGEIIEGEAHVDEALISGESKPIKKGVGDKVVAGSICLDGSLKIKLTAVGEASTVGQIKQLIEKASQTKPETQRLADRAASYLTVIAVTVALLTLLYWSFMSGMGFVFGLTLAITVLVITCPHALGLAIPTVTTIATSLAVKNGIFIKDLAKLEVVKDVGYVVFDKTGTLTKGEFGIKTIKVLDEGLSEAEALKIAAGLEAHSSHVIGMAFVKKAKEKGIKVDKVTEFKNVAGKGIRGKVGGKKYVVGNLSLMQEAGVLDDKAQSVVEEVSNAGETVVVLADEKKVLAVFGLSDQVKPEAYKAVKRLHAMGIRVAMLTGDHAKVAAEVAKELGIDTFFAEVLPEDKYKHVRELQEAGYKVMMVGDGVNDAPALVQADVGVAIGAGTDVAIESGDVVLTDSNPLTVVRLIKLSKATYQKMIENLWWALGYNIVAIPAAAGVFARWGVFLRPEVGALLMSLSSVIVVVNAMRLKKIQLES